MIFACSVIAAIENVSDLVTESEVQQALLKIGGEARCVVH